MTKRELRHIAGCLGEDARQHGQQMQKPGKHPRRVAFHATQRAESLRLRNLVMKEAVNVG